VVVATGQGFADLIEGAGLSSRSLSIDFKTMLESPEVQASLTTLRGKLATYRAMKFEMARQYEEMWTTLSEEKPDFLVVSPKGFPAVPMARALKIPCYSTTLQPNYVPRGDFPQFLFSGSFGRWGNRLTYRLFNWLALLGQNQSFGGWAKTHMPSDFDARLADFSGFHPDGRKLPILQGFSRHIAPSPPEWSEQTAPTTGYWFRPPPKGVLPAALETFLQQGLPPVYVGFGSMPVADAGRIAGEVVSALRKVGRRGVLSIGWGGLKGASQSEDMFVLDSAPHELLFPRCCLVVHHGGAGTTHEGLRWGRPTVICPAGVDQPFWARRLRALGVAPEALPLKRLDADSLALRLESALLPEVVVRAEQLGRQIRTENGAGRAADVILSAWQ
jgi:sterol 3beta-glucosyltransferase